MIDNGIGSQKIGADIPASYSRLIARELNLLAKDLPRLLKDTSLETKQLLSDDSLITVEQQVKILRNALELDGRPELGLRLGKRLTPATHGAMGFVAYSSPDYHTALKAIQTFLPTRASFIKLSLRHVDGYLECILDFKGDLDDDVQRCLSDTMVKTLLEFGEFMIGRPLHEAKIYFKHRKPEYYSLYPEYLSGRFFFDHEQLQVKLPLDACLEPNASANHKNYQLALQQCESMLEKLQPNQPTYQTRLKKMMLSRPPGTLSEDEAAASLFMSKRTLARKLRQESSGFRKIRDEILSQQAFNYLRDTQLTIEAIAALMNYHDSSNFRRAFKRWYGTPPEQFRLNIRNKSSNLFEQ